MGFFKKWSTALTGGRYEGEFKEGRYHGQGVKTWEGIFQYVGGFKEGRYHGQGVATFADGRRYEGEWKYGLFEGKGTLTRPDGTGYEGEYKLGRPHGQGVMVYANGAYYEGEWKYGKYFGQGAYTWDDGTSEKGGYINGLAHGKMIVTFPDGLQEERLFQYGDDLTEGPSPVFTEYGGLGLVVGAKGNYFEVYSTMDDTPAYRAGLKAGDIILQIGDQNVNQINLDEGIKLMRGVPGTSVKLTIKRPDLDPFVVEITREIIPTSPKINY